jgi:hypothetical protein
MTKKAHSRKIQYLKSGRQVVFLLVLAGDSVQEDFFILNYPLSQLSWTKIQLYSVRNSKTQFCSTPKNFCALSLAESLLSIGPLL